MVVYFENITFFSVDQRLSTAKIIPSFFTDDELHPRRFPEDFQIDVDPARFTYWAKFICNGTIEIFSDRQDAPPVKQVLLVPGVKQMRSVKAIDLTDDVKLSSKDGHLVIDGRADLSLEEIFALGLAVGGPLKLHANIDGDKISLVLNHGREAGRYRPFFHRATPDGVVDPLAIANSVPLVFGAACRFQDDGRSDLRIISEAFLEVWSGRHGYNLKALAASQIIDGLVKVGTGNTNKQADVPQLKALGLTHDEAEFVRAFRNWIVHGNLDLLGFLASGKQNGSQIIGKSEQELFARFGIGGTGDATLNFLLSFAAKTLLQRMGLDVPTSLNWPVNGEFSFDRLRHDGASSDV
ncbi:MAG: hypothetical protein II336_03620 [Loktanella sp.]|nr:hypothetical protein [Loktanella sp.]